jgi:hypothetical protein
VPAQEQRCFFEILERGDHLHISYQVGEGGHLDIDFWVRRDAVNRVFVTDRDVFPPFQGRKGVMRRLTEDPLTFLTQKRLPTQAEVSLRTRPSLHRPHTTTKPRLLESISTASATPSRPLQRRLSDSTSLSLSPTRRIPVSRSPCKSHTQSSHAR